MLPIIHMVYPKIAQIYVVSLQVEKGCTPLASSPPPSHLGGRGRGRNMCCREERRESLRRTPTISIFKLPVSIFRTPSGSSQLGVGGGGPSTVTDLCRGWGGQNSQLKIISSTCKPSPSHSVGGGANLGGSGQATAIRWVFFL